MEFSGSINESQFIPSNLLSNKLKNESDDDLDSYKQYFDNQVIGFRPRNNLNSSTSERTTRFRVMHIKSDDVQDFEIPFQKGLNDTDFSILVNNDDANDLNYKKSCNSEPDYSDYDYETVLINLDKLLWSGPHWQIEKLLMDIAFSEDTCVNSEEKDEQIIRTMLLNNGQDGSVREYVCCQSKKSMICSIIIQISVLMNIHLSHFLLKNLVIYIMFLSLFRYCNLRRSYKSKKILLSLFEASSLYWRNVPD